MSDVSTFERARSPEHKKQRRAAILAAATELATERGVRSVTLGDIAGEVGMAKSNVLRYFGTREEIYLDLSVVATQQWLSDLAALLKAEAVVGPERVARVVADSLSERNLLCDLMAQGASTLEHNVRPEHGRDFKVAMLASTGQLGLLLAAALPGLEGEKAFEAGITTALTIAALWPTCTTPQAILDLMDPGVLSRFPATFADRLARVLHALYAGLLTI